MAGTLIILEGPDGAGTTTHARMLAERLRREGHDVLLTSEPTSGPIGAHIRDILQRETLPDPSAVQLLFTADRAEHVATVIQPALDAGKIVICDRYTLSTIVYGSVLGVDAAWLQRVNEKFPKPDLTIITLPPYDVCRKRLSGREERDQFERGDFQRRVYDGYREIEDAKTVFVDTSREAEDVAEEVYGITMLHLRHARTDPRRQGGRRGNPDVPHAEGSRARSHSHDHPGRG